eukprot:scaffold8471_cov184-Amphora_coffeaeformis.AAC.18
MVPTIAMCGMLFRCAPTRDNRHEVWRERGVARHETRVKSHESRVTSHESRVKSHEPREELWRKSSPKRGKCCHHEPNCSLDEARQSLIPYRSVSTRGELILYESTKHKEESVYIIAKTIFAKG